MPLSPSERRAAAEAREAEVFRPLMLSEAAVKTATADAIQSYWRTLRGQTERGSAGDRGGRAGATGGKQLDGIVTLLARAAISSGVKRSDIYFDSKVELPGFYRPEKKWDILVLNGNQLVAVAETKAQAGPSFGNNFNNRVEEAIGSGTDLNRAVSAGLLDQTKRCWTGWLLLLEDCPASRKPVSVRQSHFQIEPSRQKQSYVERYRDACRRLAADEVYSATALLYSPKGDSGLFSEPDPAHGALPFLWGFAEACRRGAKVNP